MAQDHTNLISPADADVLLHAHDGDCALLCLWILRTGSRDLEHAARDLCMTRAQVDAAAEKLGRMLPALFSSAPADARDRQAPPASPPADDGRGRRTPEPDRPAVLPPADELPEYTAEEIASADRDSSFHAVRDLAETLLGKELTRHDLGRLLGIYNHLGLPAEVIFVLLHYCAEVSKGPAGADRKPTVNFIERQAYVWVNRGITSAELAEEYVEKQRLARENENRVKRILEIYDRNLTPTERNNISAWIDMGFADDAIALAYERTLDNIGKRSLPYMNSILLRWHEAKLHTAAEITRKEPDKGTTGQRPGKDRNGNSKTVRPPFVPTEF